MQYRSLRMDGVSEDLTKERAQNILEGYYKLKFVRDIMKNNKQFRLHTPTRDIWTEDDNGLIPQPGFYGVIE